MEEEVLMKSTIGILALVAIATIGSVAPAPNVQADMVSDRQYSSYPIAPVDLVSQAYRGQFKDLGIPSYSALLLRYRWRQITAESLVEKVVEADLLPESVLSDSSYLNTVDAQLRSLESIGIFHDSR